MILGCGHDNEQWENGTWSARLTNRVPGIDVIVISRILQTSERGNYQFWIIRYKIKDIDEVFEMVFDRKDIKWQPEQF